MPQPQIVALPSLAPLAAPASKTAAAAAAAAKPASAKKEAAAKAAAAAIGSVATPYQDLELTSMRKTIAKRLTEVFGWTNVSRYMWPGISGPYVRASGTILLHVVWAEPYDRRYDVI